MKTAKSNKKMFAAFGMGLLLLVCSCLVSAQTTISLEESDTRNLVFTASIGKETMPVTFCLNVDKMSSGHRDWYAVSGWFQHMGDGESRFPLAGLKTSDRLTLYYFKDEAQADTLLNFRYDDYEKYSFNEMMERYHDMGGFLEKMSFKIINAKLEGGTTSGKGIRGEWTDGKMQLPINVYRNDLDILRYNSLLKIHHNGSDFYIDLYALNLPLFYPGDHRVQGYKVVDDTIRIVLSYERASKAYALGLCGAGNEDGFLRLEINSKNGHLLKLNDYRIVSCLKHINAKVGYRDEKQESYIVTAPESTRFLNFNKETMALEWEGGG